jgi:hypothetical protein
MQKISRGDKNMEMKRKCGYPLSKKSKRTAVST